MARQFGRELEILIGTDDEVISVDNNFKVRVEVTKNLKKSEPDEASITIVNLNESSRRKAADEEFKSIVISGGYSGNKNVVFSGKVQTADPVKSGTEWITTITAGDGADAIADSFLSKSYNSGLPVSTIIRDCAQAMGLTLELTPGNYTRATLPRGKVADDSTRNILDKLGITYDLEWSVQDSVLVVVPKNASRIAEPVLLSSKNGLLGTPEFVDQGSDTGSKTKKSTRGLRFRSLLRPLILPGRNVVIESPALKGEANSYVFNRQGRETIQGLYKVTKVVHTLETFGGDFITACESEIANG